MAKKETFYWNDDTMSLSWKGKDYVAGDSIPEEYQEEQEEKFDQFCQEQKISKNKKVKFEERQMRELKSSRKVVDKLTVKNKEMVAEIKSLEQKIEGYQASFEDLKNLQDLKGQLAMSEQEKKDLNNNFENLKSEKESADEKLIDLELKIEELEKVSADFEALKGDKKGLEKLLKGLSK